jgi:hypothetical protein
MAAVLTMASSVTCGHGPGKVQTSSAQKLTVGGNPVLVKASIAGRSVSGCTTPSDPNSGSVTCTAVTAVTAGDSTKLTAGSGAVTLASLAGGTNGTVSSTPQTLLSATAGQTKLTAA